MAILRFLPNVPQQATLRSLRGRVVDSKFGGVQHLFDAEEGVFYVSDTVGAILTDQFEKLGVVPGQTVEITKGVNGSGPGAKTRWIVTLSSDATEPEPPSELEQKLATSIAMVESRKAAAQAQSQTAGAQPDWAQVLLLQTNVLSDVYAAALAHASATHGNAIKPEDIRALLTTAFINLSQKGANGRAA